MSMQYHYSTPMSLGLKHSKHTHTYQIAELFFYTSMAPGLAMIIVKPPYTNLWHLELKKKAHT